MAKIVSILESPADLSRRLDYARAIEQSDPARAEFIRIQVQLDEMDEADSNWRRIKACEAELLDRHFAEWTRNDTQHQWRENLLRGCWMEPTVWFGPVYGGSDRWRFGSGFLETACMPANEFVERGKQIFAAAPLRDLSLYNVFSRRKETSLLNRIRALEKMDAPQIIIDQDHQKLQRLRDCLPVDSLAECEFLRRLHALGVIDSDLGDDDILSLVTSPHLQGIEELRLGLSNMATSASAEAVASSPHLNEVTALDFSSCSYDIDVEPSELGDEGAISLSRSKCLPSLERLTLAANRIGTSGLAALLARPGLTYLDLSDNLFHDESIHEAVRLANPTELRSLVLNDIGGRADTEGIGLTAKSLPSLSRLKSLRHLNLTSCSGGFRSISARELAAELHLPELTWLSFDSRFADPGDFQAFADAPQFASLRHLEVECTTDEELIALVTSPHLTQLTSLSLWVGELTDVGLRALAAAGNLTHLQTLRLKGELGSSVYDAELEALATSPHLSNLSWLEFHYIRLESAAAAETIAKSPTLDQLRAFRCECSVDAEQVLRRRWGHRLITKTEDEPPYGPE